MSKLRNATISSRKDSPMIAAKNSGIFAASTLAKSTKMAVWPNT